MKIKQAPKLTLNCARHKSIYTGDCVKMGPSFGDPRLLHSISNTIDSSRVKHYPTYYIYAKQKHSKLYQQMHLNSSKKLYNHDLNRHNITSYISSLFVYSLLLLVLINQQLLTAQKFDSDETFKSRNVLNRLVKHFEPLNYNHKIVHRRAKRDLNDAKQQNQTPNNDLTNHQATHPIKLNFKAHNRIFELRLKPDSQSVFKESTIIEDSDGKLLNHQLKNPLILLSGHLEGTPETSLVFGSLRKGIFEGRIETNDSLIYYVENSRKYVDDLKANNEKYKNITGHKDLGFHSVIYSSTDVIHPHKSDDGHHIDSYVTLPSHASCAGDKADIKEWLGSVSKSAIEGSEIDVLPKESSKTESAKDRFYRRMHEMYGLPYDSNHYSYIDLQNAVQNDNKYSYEATKSTHHNHSRSKRQAENIFDLNMFGPKPRISHRPQGELNQRQKRACTLYIQTDNHLWNHARKNHDNDLDTREEIASLVAQHIKAVNHIYENSDFGGIRGIKFIVQRLKINDTSACEGSKVENNQFCKTNMDVSNFLNLNSQFNHNDFCLAYIFTYRDFSGGTLGLAWVASTSGASGGICEKYKTYNESVGGRQIKTNRSLNTGIITFVNYNTRVPPKVSELTLAHEIGHNFGSPHDYPQECRPGGTLGNYIMYSSATSGERANNNKFSECSIRNISSVLQNLFSIDGKDNCFEVDNGPFCGNKIVEEGEQCDCGYNSQECTEQCCVPREKSDEIYEGLKSCQRMPGKQCSPSEGPCCNDECSLVGTEKVCRQETECSHSQTCNSLKATCPEPEPKPNMTECNNGTQVCMSGKCGGSICMKYHLEECFIQDTCEVACQKHDQPQSCKRTSEIPAMRHLSGLNLRPGSPCNNFLGFCDTQQKCKAVDAEGPLAKLKNLLFNQRTLTTIKQWAITHWWACALFIIGFLMFMYVFIECCAVHTPSSNPKLGTALKLAETLRHPSNTLRRKRRPGHGRVVANGHRRHHHSNIPSAHHRRDQRPSSSSRGSRNSKPQPTVSSRSHPNSSRQQHGPQPPSASNFPAQPMIPSNKKPPPPLINSNKNCQSNQAKLQNNLENPRPLNDPKLGIIGGIPGLPAKQGWHNRRNQSSSKDNANANQTKKR